MLVFMWAVPVSVCVTCILAEIAIWAEPPPPPAVSSGVTDTGAGGRGTSDKGARDKGVRDKGGRDKVVNDEVLKLLEVTGRALDGANSDANRTDSIENEEGDKTHKNSKKRAKRGASPSPKKR